MRNKSPRERDALALSTRDREATVADLAVEPTELLDHLRRAGGSHGVEHHVVADLAPGAEEQVVAQRRREEQRLLADDPDGLAQLAGVEVGELDAVERHGALVGVDETRGDACKRGLPTPRRPGRHHELTQPHLEVETVEEAALTVGDLHAVQLEPARGQRDHPAVGDRARAQGEHLGDAVLGAPEVLPRAGDLAEGAGELAETLADLEREEEGADAEAADAHEVGAGGEQCGLYQQRHHAEVDVVTGEEAGARHRVPEGSLGHLAHALALAILAPERLHHPDPAYRLVDCGGDLGALVQFGPAERARSDFGTCSPARR